MKKIIGALLCSLLFTGAMAQQRDFIVKTNGDSVFAEKVSLNGHAIGLMNNKEWEYVPMEEVRYVKGDQTGTIYYGKIMYYEDDLSLQVKKETGDTMMAVRAIYETPKMTLFQGTDANGKTHYFVQRPGDPIPTHMMVRYEIIRQQSIDVPIFKASTQQRQSKIYTGQLKGMFGDCKIREAEWEAMDYRSYSFKRIIKLYNKCK